MEFRARVIGLVLLALLFSACNTLRFVPEDKFLLDKTRVRVSYADTNHIPSADKVSADGLKKYLQQKQNSEIFGFWKLQLQVYSSAGKDSTKWINRALWRMGQAPEVFDPALADYSCQQLRRAMFNRGYFNAEVDTMMTVKNRRLALTYSITPHLPYYIRSYQVALSEPALRHVALLRRECLVHEGDRYKADVLNQERERIARAMRKDGYYYFEQDYLQFTADSTLSHQGIALRLGLRDYVEDAPDSLRERLFRQYTIRRVEFELQDSLRIRPSVLRRSCYVKAGDLYNIENVERTYQSMTAMPPVKYVSLSFTPEGEDGLVCHVLLSKGKIHSVSVEAEGTYSAGDWGVSGGVGYATRNLFRGAEEFSLSASGGYEWRQTGGRAIEAKAEASVRFVKAPEVSVSYQFQRRPEEFTRTIASAGLSYRYQGFDSRWAHRFSFVDISYVRLPEISEAFSEQFLRPTNPLRYSYEDHFILSLGYAGSYSSQRKDQPLRSYFTMRYAVETAGNLLYGISSAFLEKDQDGAYKIFDIRYSQYAKGDFMATWNQILSKRHRLVLHGALGVAVPYGNAVSIPFEKRYFAGGANSVRGWQARNLGPGAYRGTGGRIDYNNQSGDIKLDLNLEYRWRVWSIVELAAFTDAGNIWTIRDYASQPHGLFRFDTFYRQLAWSYGVGVRLDFSFFIFRLDLGVKLYDPSRIYYDARPWRTASNGLGWHDDMTLHFAIGYPF